MAYSEDHIALAAEYALGTLDAGERAQVETMMAVDKEFAAVVQAWEYRLGVLNQMVGSVEPRPIVWENIRSELARTDFAQETPAPELRRRRHLCRSLPRSKLHRRAGAGRRAATGAAAFRSRAARDGATGIRCASRHRADIHAAGPCARS